MTRRILINARLYGAGGRETHLLNLCKLLVKNGAEVTLVSRFARSEAELVRLYREIPIHLLATPFAANLRWFRFSTIWALLFWPLYLRNRKYDVLYTLEISPFTRFLAQFVKPGGRVVLNHAGNLLDANKGLNFSEKRLLDSVIVESSMHAEAARQAYGDDLPIMIIPHIGYIDAVPARRKEKGGDLINVAFLGRYDRAKGIYRLLEIWPKLNIGPAHLGYYGYGQERDGLIEEVRNRGLQKSVSVHGGWCDSKGLGLILNNTDLVILPSETEGLPVILLETMAHGVPFVASDVGAVRTLAEDNPDVRVVQLDNNELISSIEEMVRAIHSRAVRGNRLQSYYQDRYSHEMLSQRWIDSLLFPERIPRNNE